MDDRFFERTTPAGTSYAEFRYSPISFGTACVARIDDRPPELLSGSDELDYLVSQRIEKLEREGYKPVATATLPGIQTPAVIEAITGHAVPTRYARFLEEGPHPKGTVDGITNFADGIPIVFDDPVIPFALKRFGWDKKAPNAIPIAIVEEGRALSIDAKTGEIYVYDNSATKPHVKVCKNLDALLANVKAAKPKSKATKAKTKMKTKTKTKAKAKSTTKKR